VLIFFTFVFFFFFQAEDGIRDRNVTGVQTCALPISSARAVERFADANRSTARADGGPAESGPTRRPSRPGRTRSSPCTRRGRARSEERRVGKEGRARW